MSFKFQFRENREFKPVYLFSLKTHGILSPILILSMALIIVGCVEPTPRRAISVPERGPEIIKLDVNSGNCMTEVQCEESKTKFLENCEKKSISEFDACRVRLKAKFKSCCEAAGYTPAAIAAEDCSSCSKFNENTLKQNRWLYCHRSECNWPVNCKTADNIVAPNDRDGLWSCCEVQAAKERSRCDKEMADNSECERIERIAVNACMMESPASKASAYIESAPKPLQPNAQPSGGLSGAPPRINSQPSE